MRTENLMIGDWVCYDDGSIPNFIPQQIAEIHCLGEVQFSNGLDMAKEYIHPIPITTEILKINGFRLYARYPGEDIWMEYNHNIEVVITDYASTIRVFTIDDIDDGKDLIFLTEIGRTRYVHELQHALRLCGLNELADNFKIGENIIKKL